MPDVLLFGATGYTGRLVASALFRRGVDFAVAGRNPDELARISDACGGVEARLAEATQIGSLVDALGGCRVLATTVGPFAQWGEAAVEAALRAGVHYIDCCGEGSFIEALFDRYSERARRAGLVLAPAMGFDEVVAEVAATLAVEGLELPDLILTYAAFTSPSPGTIRSGLGIAASPGAWLEDGRVVDVDFAQRTRWAPMPPPLGPKPSLSAPLAELQLAPRHLELGALQTYLAVERFQALAAPRIAPVMRWLRRAPALRSALAEVASRLLSLASKDDSAEPWSLLAEARSGRSWRNVALRGSGVYQISAELVAAGATALASEPLDVSGVLTPVQAFGTDFLHKQLINLDVSVEVYQETSRL